MTHTSDLALAIIDRLTKRIDALETELATRPQTVYYDPGKVVPGPSVDMARVYRGDAASTADVRYTNPNPR